MCRFSSLTLVVCAFCAGTAHADDYLLRLETIGYVDRPLSETHPKETVLQSIEVVARPDSTFHSKVTVGGNQTLTLTGTLRPADNGAFTVNVRYVHSIETGATVPIEGGVEKPVPDTMAISTTMVLSAGESNTIGGIDTKVIEAATPKRQSKRHCVLTLTKHVPTAD